jgi:hypothetical protein
VRQATSMNILGLRRQLPSGRKLIARYLCATENPQQLLNEATTLLSSFSDKLQKMSEVVRKDPFKEIVMSCRDADVKTFKEMASYRDQMLPIALELEQNMQEMSTTYTESIVPKMAAATQVCRETPDGGISWLVASGEIELTGNERFVSDDTPCGKFAKKSADFMGLTLETRQDAELGARAACFLRLAKLLNDPLVEVQKRKGGGRTIATAFQKEKVNTPWIRSDEEYQHYVSIRDKEKQ